MSAGDRGYKIIRWSDSLRALNELRCGNQTKTMKTENYKKMRIACLPTTISSMHLAGNLV